MHKWIKFLLIILIVEAFIFFSVHNLLNAYKLMHFLMVHGLLCAICRIYYIICNVSLLYLISQDYRSVIRIILPQLNRLCQIFSPIISYPELSKYIIINVLDSVTF